ncbi:MAG: hypothetical protein PHF86_05555 [Candidatus Nanoarchaeia archaeon]|nr:hypothetical protein [Candidatus Nanoarchaeia archaeon]
MKQEQFDVWKYFLDLNPNLKQALLLAGLGLTVFNVGKTYNFFLYIPTLIGIFILGLMQVILGIRQFIIDMKVYEEYKRLKKRKLIKK